LSELGRERIEEFFLRPFVFCIDCVEKLMQTTSAAKTNETTEDTI
jgi:hypothetical protein